MAFPDIRQNELIEKISKRVYLEGIMNIKPSEAPAFVTKEMGGNPQYKRIRKIIEEEVENEKSFGGIIKR